MGITTIGARPAGAQDFLAPLSWIRAPCPHPRPQKGLALEISTSLYPQHFLLLASTGNFTKALAKGMGKPVFRVVQTHFAASGNVGAVAAKEEVWEVSAQLVGSRGSARGARGGQRAGARPRWNPLQRACGLRGHW
mgnify:CR=1 FL=1